MTAIENRPPPDAAVLAGAGQANPEQADPVKDSRTFRITFMPSGKAIEVGAVDPMDHHEGRPGSILDWALKKEVALDHACGGFAACSTCHVVVKQGLETCNEISEDEEDMLDEAPGLTLQSRLACQTIPDGSKDLVVEVPAWNRNLAREGKH